VIGIVRETKHFGPEQKVRWMQLYLPEYQNPTPALAFIVNTTLPEAAVNTAAGNAIHAIDKDLPVESFSTMDAYLDTMLSGRKVSLFLLSAFAAITVLLGAIGIYGTVASSVIQRRRDIAIRMAVGATPSRIILLVTRFGLLMTLAGIAVGSAVIAGMTRLLASLLFGISPLDPITYAASAIIIIFSAAIASIIPAMRLFRFNIQEILRQ
jgi:putative ABC transport system permease protein